MSKKYEAPYAGKCLCGTIRYQVDKIEPHMAHCHCSMCRKFHGAAFATFGEARKENFRWTSGEEHLTKYVAENNTVRQFCNICGSSLTFAPAIENFEYVEFALGTLDSDIALRPDAHIFYGSKANWFVSYDELSKYVEGRDSDLA